MAADFRAARPEKAARELVIVVYLYPVGDAALTSPSRSLEFVIGHCIRYCGASGCRLLGEERKWLVRARKDVNDPIMSVSECLLFRRSRSISGHSTDAVC